MDQINKIIDEMCKFYSENGSGKTLDYTFGFCDALSVLKKIQEELR